jgi:hypothetical protein
VDPHGRGAEVGDGLGALEVEPDRLQAASRGQLELDADRGQLRRVRGLVVGRLEPVGEALRVLGGDEALQRRPGPVLGGRRLGDAQVPEVAAVERDPQHIALAPHHRADPAVAERGALVPAGDRGVQGQLPRGRLGRQRQREQQGRRRRGRMHALGW